MVEINEDSYSLIHTESNCESENFLILEVVTNIKHLERAKDYARCVEQEKVHVFGIVKTKVLTEALEVVKRYSFSWR